MRILIVFLLSFSAHADWRSSLQELGEKNSVYDDPKYFEVIADKMSNKELRGERSILSQKLATIDKDRKDGGRETSFDGLQEEQRERKMLKAISAELKERRNGQNK